MNNAWQWVSGLFGNNPKVKILIFVFLAILIGFAIRCSAQTQVHLAGGASFGALNHAPVLALDVETPLGEGLAWSTGTHLWGSAGDVRSNWDIHAKIEFSRGSFGAAIGPALLVKADSVDGSRLNFNLMLFWRPWRVGVEMTHISNGGAVSPNSGRTAVLVDWRIR